MRYVDINRLVVARDNALNAQKARDDAREALDNFKVSARNTKAALYEEYNKKHTEHEEAKAILNALITQFRNGVL